VPPPLFEEGLRDEVIERWQAEGLRSAADLHAVVHYDRRERLTLDASLRPGPAEGLPCDLPPSELRARLRPGDPARMPENWDDCVRAWRDRECVLEVCVHSGFFLTQGADRWDAVERVLLMARDEPGRLRGVMEAVADCVVGLIERLAVDVQPDMAIFSEPISGPDRPLIGPRTYEDLVLSTYRPIIAALRAAGCPVAVFQTYANSRALLPGVVEAGFDCLWAVESGEGAMDYREIRATFGNALRLIGGVDLDLLRTDPATIRCEMERAIPPLLAGGAYIPLADGRVRPDVPLANYLAYRRALERLVGVAR
jgi:hypothetical protein